MEIANKFIKLKVDESGAGIYSLKYLGKELIWQKKSGYWPESAPVLFPFCGFLKDGFYLHDNIRYEVPAHGFASSQIFEIDSFSDSKICLCLKSNKETLQLYPFNFELKISYELFNSALLISFTVKNTEDKKTLPFSIGWHPGFQISEGACIKFSKSEFKRKKVVEGGLIGSESSFFLKNNTLILNEETLKMGGIVLENPSADISLLDKNYELSFDFKEFPYLVIWGQPGAGFICIEPWYGMGDKADHKHQFTGKESLIHLEPGREKTLNSIIKIKA